MTQKLKVGDIISREVIGLPNKLSLVTSINWKQERVLVDDRMTPVLFIKILSVYTLQENPEYFL